jgi:hypothetical protein
MRMLDGFNEGWIAFEGSNGTIRKGTFPLKDVLKALVEAK